MKTQEKIQNSTMNTSNNHKGMMVLMNAIDSVLQDIVWVNKNSEVVNLKQLISVYGDMAKLSYDDLIGAYTCLQIRYESFSESVDGKSVGEIVARIKEMVFTEARSKLLKLGLCKENQNGDLVCENQKVA